ncbi:Glycosyl transferase [Lysobacter dokdonensis DS-58]|uniref:Glycosyl transferase n=1 Tax=Lysobacter dokdonensis DS-58 TaxID=1300345 RepID=A0A0A2WYK8_9GAMM|nr:Glycosyl transferase [Lysobacter dokdonensis DS-58]
MREIAVVIVDHAGLPSLQRCVHALRETTAHAPFDIVVASTRPQPLRDARFTGMRWACTAHAGIAQACNRAVDAIANDIVVLVDSRCRGFDADWLRALVDHARQPDIGLVAPQRNEAVFDARNVVAYGCLAVRRHVFLRESGFDPSYQDLACATTDLAMRIGLRGLRHRTLPSVQVRLIESSTISRLLGRGRERADRNRLQAAWRHAFT